MDLGQFKILYKKFSSGKADKDAWRTKEYSDYCDAMLENDAIGEWYLRQQIKKSKVKVGRHCCTKMTYYLTFDVATKNFNPDAIVRFHKKMKDYGLPIHDGGQSFIKIEFCPWCGARLTRKRK